MINNLILIFFISFYSLNSIAEIKSDKQIALDLQEGQRFTNSIAVGIVFSSMSKCIGENPDSEIAKVAGSLLVSTAIAEFYKTKLGQIDPYKYSFDQTGLVNDAQKLSITGEQIINNTKYLTVLKDKSYSEESIKKQLEVAESVAYRELIAMQASRTECLDGIYYGAYKAFWNPVKERWVYGKCAWDWGDNNERAIGCSKFKAEETTFKAKNEGKVSSDLKQKRADCKRAAINAANSSRILSIKTADDCAEKCDDAARICHKCKLALRAAKEWGIPSIEQLLSAIEPSSINSAKILKAHHNTMVKMYKICGRDDVLTELKSIKSVSTKVDPQFEKIQGDSAEIYQKYGGLATTDLNKYRTDKNRSADDVHNADIGDEPSSEIISEFKLTKENLFDEIPVDSTLPTEGKPVCGDMAAKACGEYSKHLMKSLNSCSETLHSTVYHQMFNEVKNHYASVIPLNDFIFYSDIIETFKYFTMHGIELLTPDANAKSMTATVGGSIGLGGDWLKILYKNQKNLINVFDPLLSTYNKRIFAYQLARDLIDLSLTNTKKNIQHIETRLVELKKIKSTLDTSDPLAQMPILSAKVTQDVDHKWDPDVKAFLDLVCNQSDCSHVSQNISSTISAINSQNSNVTEADKSVLKASSIISSVGDILYKDKKLSQNISDNIDNLHKMGPLINAGRLVLQNEANQSTLSPSHLSALKNNLLSVFIKEPPPAPISNVKEIIKETPVNTDNSIFYTEINKQKNNMITSESTKAKSSDANMEYEELSDKDISLLQNDLVNNENVSLWDIISTRYIKVKDRLE